MAIKGQLGLEIGQFNGNLKKAEENVRRSTARMKKDSKGVGAGFSGGFSGAVSKGIGVKGLSGPLLAAAAGYKVAQFAADSFNAAMERESLLAGLAANSTEDVSKQMERLTALAKEPGLGMTQVIEGSTRLQAVGMSAADSESMLREMGNALASVGKGKADMDGVILALTQISAKGKISAQEINQLAERLPQIRRIMQEAFGTSDTDVLRKMGVSADEFFSKITTAMEGMERAEITTNEKLSNLSDEFLDLKIAAGEALVPIANELIPMASDAFKALATAIKAPAEALRNLESIGGSKFFEDQMKVTLELQKQLQIMQKRGALPDPSSQEKTKPDRPTPKPLTEAEEKAKKREDDALKKKGESLRDKLDGRQTSELLNSGDVDGLKQKMEGIFADALPVGFEESISGMEALVKARLDSGNIVGADDAMAWLEDATKLQEKITQISEKTAESLASLREQAATGAFDLLNPEEQAAQMRAQLSESLGIDITGGADVERGLAALRSDVEEMRKLGDKEGEKTALEKLNAAQSSAKDLAGLAKTDGETTTTRFASGSVANGLAQIMGRASQDDVLLDVNRSQVTVMKQLTKVLTDIKTEGIKTDKDIFTF